MAVLELVGVLAGLDPDTPKHEVWEAARDRVLVERFGARPGFGDGPDEHRFRIDNHWPPKT